VGRILSLGGVYERAETIETMTLILMTTLTLITAIDGETILKTNYGFSLESLEAQVHFSTDNGRIVLCYTMPRIITAEKPHNKK